MSDGIAKLCERFLDRIDEYTHPQYSEAQVRIDFLNPMFELLGWDVTNRSGLSVAHREVVTEPRQRGSDGAIEFPDYLFRLEGRPMFPVEAKKPSVKLLTDPVPALQLRRYAWNSREMGIGILTDFQEFAVYDTRIAPQPGDSASKMRVLFYTVDQYVDAWPEIEALFSRDAVAEGALDEYVRSLTAQRGKQRVDQAFLLELDRWRHSLAQGLSKSNNLDRADLNYAVQLTIDRIVFLRICEDRGIEPYGDLLAEVQRPGIYSRLVDRFARADEKFNSGLFHFTPEKGRDSADALTPTLVIPDEDLRGFIERLYWPDGPYNFAVLPADVLGHVYEQFLGSVITVDSDHNATVVEKPEVRKAGGVFYTPTTVVQHIVESTLGSKLAGLSVTSSVAQGLTVCDPACGSGSFLLEVYEYLLRWYLDQYLLDPNKWSKTRPKRLQRDVRGDWRLTIDERKRILVQHVFGVDIDSQAVEVTKLALLLKVLEGEDQASLHAQTELFHERVLPDLDANIKCGNSLVGTAFHADGARQLDITAEEEDVNAFDWPVEFDAIARRAGFDVIVGNPPWLMAGYYVDNIVPYLKSNFSTASGKFDLYYVFLEQSLRLLAPDGEIGMIVPNKFFHTTAARALRTLLATECRIESIADFGIVRVFEGATNYSCVLRLSRRTPSSTIAFTEVGADLRAVREFKVDRSVIDRKTWVFQDADATNAFEQMTASGVTLESLVSRFGTGVQSGSDTVLTFTAERAQELGLESALLRPIFRGRDVRAYRLNGEPKLLLFPYVDTEGGYRLLSEREMKMYPNAWSYLSSNRKKLADRVWFAKSAQELSGAWYGLMYVEHRSTVAAPHLLTPALSSGSNFALGDGSLWSTGTAGVTALVLRESPPWSLDALLGILNSKPLSVFADAHSPIYQGGAHKYSAPYLKELRVPTQKSGVDGDRQRSDLTQLVADVMDGTEHLRSNPTGLARTRLERRVAGSRHAIDEIVMDAFGLDGSARAWFESR